MILNKINLSLFLLILLTGTLPYYSNEKFFFRNVPWDIQMTKVLNLEKSVKMDTAIEKQQDKF